MANSAFQYPISGGGGPYITGTATGATGGVSYSDTSLVLKNPGSTTLWELLPDTVTTGWTSVAISGTGTTPTITGNPPGGGGTFLFNVSATIQTGTGAKASCNSRQFIVVAPTVVDPTALSIYNKMTGYWDLHEVDTGTNTTRVDQINGMNLGAGSVGNGVGPRGTGDIAATFNGTGSTLISATYGSTDPASIPTGGGSHCVGGWVYLNNSGSNQYIMGRWDTSSSSSLEYLMTITSGTARFYNGGSSYTIAQPTAPSTGSWHFWCGWRDSADGKVRMNIDGGTIDVSSAASNPSPQSIQTTMGITPGGGPLFDGRLSRMFWIKGDFLTSTEITWMINSGMGRDWLEIAHLAGH